MNNLLKLGKKIFTVGVASTTIFWSLGVAALVPAVATAATTVDCDTVVAGDFVKANGADIWVVNSDKSRSYFPHGDIYKSWTADGKYTFKYVTGECLSSFPAAGIVAPRPGAYLLKDNATDKLYVTLENGQLAEISAAAAAGLYGSNYAALPGKGGRTIPATSPDMVLFGKSLSSTKVTEATPAAGTLVSNGGKYYVVGASKTLREVSDTGLTANKFQTKLAVALASTSGFTVGTSVTALESGLSDATFGFKAAPGTVPPTNTGLTSVSLGATPASASVPKNGSRVPFTTVVLTAGSTGASVDTLYVKRAGLSVYSDFSKVWAEKDGVRVSSQQSFNSTDEAILNFSPALSLSAGQTVTLSLVASLSGAGTGNASVGASATSEGSYVYGQTMHFVDYTVATFTLTSGTTTNTLKVGDTSVELFKFDFQPNKDVYFKTVMFKNNGNEDLAKTLSNLALEESGNVVSSAVTVNGRYVTFTLKNGGMLVEKNDSRTFRVKGDVVGKESTSDHALVFALNKAEDISVVEKNTGFGSSLSTSVPLDLGNVDFDAGSITVTKKTSSPSDTDVIKGAKSVVAFVANVKADDTITAEGLKLVAVSSDFASFENAKVTLNGRSLGTVTPSTSMTFDSSFTLNKGDNELKVYVDVASLGTTAATIKFSINGTTFLSGQTPQYLNGNNVNSGDINGSPVGATFTIQGAGLSATRNDGYTDTRTIVRGATANVLAKFNLKATYDNVTLNSVEVTPFTTSDQITDSAVSNMELFLDGGKVGTTRDYTSSGATFSSLSKPLAKDVTKPFEVRADFDSTNTGTIKFLVTFNFEDSRGKSTSTAVYSAITTVTSSGSVVVAESGSPDAGILLAKAGVEQTVAQFKLSAVKDMASFTEVSFDNNGVTTTDSRINAYKLYKGSTLLSTENPTLGTTTFKLSPGALDVAANGSETVTLKAVFNTIEDRDNTSSSLKARLTAYKYKDSAGSENTVDGLTAYTGNQMVVRKTMPTFANVSLGTIGGGSTSEELLKFTVSADSNEDVVITTLTFTKGGSGSASTTDYKLYEGDTQRGSTTSTANFTGLSITVGKGSVKTFTVKADTSLVAKDLKVALTLEKDGNNVQWEEYFADGGNVSGGGDTYLQVLPISNSKTF